MIEETVIEFALKEHIVHEEVENEVLFNFLNRLSHAPYCIGIFKGALIKSQYYITDFCAGKFIENIPENEIRETISYDSWSINLIERMNQIDSYNVFAGKIDSVFKTARWPIMSMASDLYALFVDYDHLQQIIKVVSPDSFEDYKKINNIKKLSSQKGKDDIEF